jgi:hypothetical protein
VVLGLWLFLKQGIHTKQPPRPNLVIFICLIFLTKKDLMNSLKTFSFVSVLWLHFAYLGYKTEKSNILYEDFW